MSLSDHLTKRYPVPEERYVAANVISHEIARRFRAEANAAPPLKACPGCGLELELTAFGAHAGRADGLQVRCRSCRRGGCV